MRKLLVPAAVVVMAVVLLMAGCGGDKAGETAPSGQPGQTAGDGAKAFTAEELARYDGQNGQPAYVAVDGVVYDVTGSRMWPQGSHTPCSGSLAGRDLSEVMKTAPSNMRASLMGFPVVGTLQ